MTSPDPLDARALDLVLVDFDDTLVETAPRFARARERLFELLADAGFDRELAYSVHHHEVDPAMRKRHGFGPQRLGTAFRETYHELCRRAGLRRDPDVGAECERLAGAVAGTPPLVDGALDALERLNAALPTVVYTQSGNEPYQLGCVEEAGALGVVGPSRVCVVAVKTAEALRATLDRYDVDDPARACMIGNSIRSDINPALEIGARAILIEVDDPWHHDVVDPLHQEFHRVPRFTDAADLLLTD